MDYRLVNLYESMLKGTLSTPKTSNLVDLYEATKKSKQTKFPATPKEPALDDSQSQQPLDNKPTTETAQSNLKGLSSEYNKLIASALKTPINEIPLPEGEYPLGKSTTITNPNDLERFIKLFSLAPSTKLSEAGDSKGSGKGEIALYWLLSKNYQVDDARDRDEPDLKIGNIGIEVKSYPGKGFKLGKFKSQINNRKILSTVFGLKALFSLKESKRPATVDVFNSKELVSALSEIKALSIALDSALNQYNYLAQLHPISILIGQLKDIEKQFGLTSLMEMDEVDAASNILKKLLYSKLSVKPRFGGYYVNANQKGEIVYYKVEEDRIKNLSKEVVVANVSASSGELQLTNAEQILTKMS
jgi:hypothetical protein